MHHVAIMKKSWGLIPKILSGEKTIESRWYQTRRTPWNRIQSGDTVFFKNSGESICAQAEVVRVQQYTISTISEVRSLIEKYGKQICLIEENPLRWSHLPHYGILIFLKNPKTTPPIIIHKSGFGSATAWLTISHIRRIQKNPPANKRVVYY